MEKTLYIIMDCFPVRKKTRHMFKKNLPHVTRHPLFQITIFEQSPRAGFLALPIPSMGLVYLPTLMVDFLC